MNLPRYTISQLLWVPIAVGNATGHGSNPVAGVKEQNYDI